MLSIINILMRRDSKKKLPSQGDPAKHYGMQKQQHQRGELYLRYESRDFRMYAASRWLTWGGEITVLNSIPLPAGSAGILVTDH